MAPPPLDFDYRRARLTRWLNSAALWIGVACSVALLLLNLNGSLSSSSFARWAIAAILLVGTLWAAVLSASIFWRYSIGLLPWILMFVIHGAGMTFALRGVSGAQNGGQPLEHDVAPAVLLLAFVLAVSLLLRAAILLREAQTMPDWLVVRKKEGARVVPKTWLFVLCWLSPLAWCVGILTAAPLLFHRPEDGPRPVTSAWFNLTLPACIVVVTARTALSLVVMERSRHGNWIRQKPQQSGWMLACYAFLTLYACVYIMALASALSAVNGGGDAAAARAELKKLQPAPLPPNQNAFTLYKLSANSYVRPPSEGMDAADDIKINLTAFSYAHQAAAMEGFDSGIDWVSATRNDAYPWRFPRWFFENDAVEHARKGEWDEALKDVRALLAIHRHFESDPFVIDPHRVLRIERNDIVNALKIFHADTVELSDKAMNDMQTLLDEHLLKRGNRARMGQYALMLNETIHANDELRKSVTWPGPGALFPMLAIYAETRSGLGNEERKIALLKYGLLTRATLDWKGINEVWDGPPPICDLRNPRPMSTNGDLHDAVETEDLKALAVIRMTQAALGALRYKRYHGTWPAKLKDCVPQYLKEIPPDPFRHGEFIHYESSPPRVYSIGTASTYLPEKHGYPFETSGSEHNTINPLLKEDGNIVLFLGN